MARAGLAMGVIQVKRIAEGPGLLRNGHGEG